MIITFFLYMISAVIGGLLLILPQGHIGPQFQSSMNLIGHYTWGFNFWLPIDTLFQVLAVWVGFEVAVFTFRFIFWVYHKFWGHSTA